jgi:uncharacterized membrane protein
VAISKIISGEENGHGEKRQINNIASASALSALRAPRGGRQNNGGIEAAASAQRRKCFGVNGVNEMAASRISGGGA